MVSFPSKKGAISGEQAKLSAALTNDKRLNISIEIDGIAAINPAHTRLSSTECFDLYGMVPAEYNTPKRYPAASDGYWVMLKPLSKGTHH